MPGSSSSVSVRTRNGRSGLRGRMRSAPWLCLLSLSSSAVNWQSIPLGLVEIESFKLSLPLSLYLNGHVGTVDSLHSRLLSQSLPDSWVVSSKSPLTLAKIRVQCQSPSARVDVAFTLSVCDDLNWSLLLFTLPLEPASCPLLQAIPTTLKSAAAVCSLMRLINSTKICIGNPDKNFLDQWRQRSLSLHGTCGN